jgi:hypothetical protein
MALPCSEPGCDAYSVAKGKCRRHYARDYTHMPQRREYMIRRGHIKGTRSRRAPKTTVYEQAVVRVPVKGWGCR